MGYRITYGEDPACWRSNGIRPGRVVSYTLACLVLFFAITMYFWPSGAERLREVLLPGDATVTAQALENMVDNLRSGEAIGDAVAVFCREIVDGAQLSN